MGLLCYKSQVDSHKSQGVTSLPQLEANQSQARPPMGLPCHKPQVASHKSQVTRHKSQVTHVTGHESQVTGHKSRCSMNFSLPLLATLLAHPWPSAASSKETSKTPISNSNSDTLSNSDSDTLRSSDRGRASSRGIPKNSNGNSNRNSNRNSPRDPPKPPSWWTPFQRHNSIDPWHTQSAGL